MWGTDDFVTDTVDESSSMSDHSGAASTLNRSKAGAGSTPTRALVMLWFILLAVYWLMGYVFKGQLS